MAAGLPKRWNADCEDVLRLMNHLGIRKEEFDAVPQTEIAKAVYEEAPADGYWFPEVCAGQEVLEGWTAGQVEKLRWDAELRGPCKICGADFV